MTQSDLFIPVLLGTARTGRRSEAVARYVHEQMTAAGVRSELIDVKDFVTDHTVPQWEKHDLVTAWKEKVSAMQGLIIVVPEYNHGYPGELKILLDKALPEYNRIPVGLVGTGGMSGGMRAVENLRTVLFELGTTPIWSALYFQGVKQLVGEDGAFVNSQEIHEQFDERVGDFVKEMAWYAEAIAAKIDSAKAF